MSTKYKATPSVAVMVYVRCIVAIVGDAEVQETLSCHKVLRIIKKRYNQVRHLCFATLKMHL
ncbi:unnamed protein product [Acanthoscelides obtectus]|uniref:Uncharacterized protein n=1 Tax=Acanthoscelides obtectus TaxID=200917 RepID=A0A9P0PCU5_ACAOB|nr:unnamed protein product [Acanthoscelides obtectus]CAK1670231.1 hypothetical protein AOBTE_LOCUS27497 [Acanthoscelides obtectus]